MFGLTVIRDCVRVAPDTFDRELLEVLYEEIDKKYSNRVIEDVGLCISTCDITKIEEAKIYPSDGAAYHRVVFRMIVFRPFVGEILVGTIASSNEDGIMVSLGFFENVFIPSYNLPTPSEYDARAKLWVWRFDEESEGGGIFHVHEQIRLRVESLTYTKVTVSEKGREATQISTDLKLPEKVKSSETGPADKMTKTGGAAAALVRKRSTSVDLPASDETEEDPPVMQINGSVDDDGLGLVIWNWE
uniref:S1 motif domain-containing protein n=1 Tax=Octactis speculum TaxID=3111310 RepID=A0A7S2DBW3_9STRA|mmetsp:Transcript_46525/g.63361  ORF Transcript_46525/g.63361 Transcript_46525/m.63361 type:complete len:245 (+) Transcript_46525:159-893(+)|eukprot:CAMPEP_0185767690 /NCGR_PEP_ID=MMETSP1174-20130828/45495_1 /TAXON_ID=35687 /ORGANISM="Dictyocha speculum, Strain CCMP1381" /LENGTH=244 /DNA_ID=CAMNT_0028452023 /DNA_START=149 /DNA_END=886 /DNA_ORIENTATION=+